MLNPFFENWNGEKMAATLELKMDLSLRVS